MPFWKKKEIRAEETEEKKSSDCSLEALLSNCKMNRENVMQIPTVSAAINKLAGDVARLPIKLYSRESGKTQEIKDDNRTFLLSVDCGDTLSIVDFWKAIIRDYYLGKGGYIYIDKHRGEVRSLRYIDCTEIAISTNQDPIFKDFDIFVQGQRYYPFDFIKILRSTTNGADSKSICQENKQILSVAYTTLLFEKTLVKKGGNKRGYFKSQKKLGEDALKDLKKAVRNLYSNNEDEDKMVVLNDGVDFKESSANPVELQLNENKTTNASEICKLFGFPSTIITGNATKQDLQQYKDCVVELLNTIEAALDKDLLKESEKTNKYFAFDTKELLRGDMKERFEAYGVALDKNFMQVDEIREREDLEPLDFNFFKIGLGDVLYNPKTTEYFVPNTGQKSNILNSSGISDPANVSKQEVKETTEQITNKTLNGAQTQSLISVIQNYQSGALTLQQATNIIAVAIGVSKDEASELIGVVSKGGEKE